MRAKLYRNITNFNSYTRSLYINVYFFKVFRNSSLLPIADRAIASYFIKSRSSNVSNLKTHCFFSANSRSVYKNYLLSRFELKRYAIIGSIVGLKVASWLFFIIFFTCINFIQLLVFLIFAKIARLVQFLYLNLIW